MYSSRFCARQRARWRARLVVIVRKKIEGPTCLPTTCALPVIEGLRHVLLAAPGLIVYPIVLSVSANIPHRLVVRKRAPVDGRLRRYRASPVGHCNSPMLLGSAPRTDQPSCCDGSITAIANGLRRSRPNP